MEIKSRPGLAQTLDEALRKEGISLRRFASPAFDACIRMTIRRHEETRAATSNNTALWRSA